ncbi:MULTISPECIES: GPW/gp25 family protein [Pedobacter]|uniref:Gene 25-like lysozyme n=1 Tax=Pedobacter cryoconitis TaxID=188932 RepID=A0A327SJV7_9SPHI|nr:GPW/gp25 family protein [Pedobacter cryoconitis]MBB5622264.1 phage baseplate assembly protein W [Pedobacter cryoconitis]MBB5647058.1 phage baseplate assembly protein W [Pedobacter cryoconitis]RAJ26027.1 gene 25-like lysozyme [Pedobacter cryoconitis]
MSDFLYNKPFRLKNILENKDLTEADLGKSISQNIELIIFTRYGEHRHNRNFGCEIWDLDFELIVSETTWEEKFRQSLLRSITEYERRLYQVEVEINMTEVEKKFSLRNVTEIKKKVDISIWGKMNITGEKYYFNTGLFLSPLSS